MKARQERADAAPPRQVTAGETGAAWHAHLSRLARCRINHFAQAFWSGAGQLARGCVGAGAGDAPGRGNGPSEDPLPEAAGVKLGHSQSASVAHSSLWKWSIRPVVFIFPLLLPYTLLKGAPGELGPSGR